MTILQSVKQAYLLAVRKPFLPNAGTTKYESLVAIADIFQKMWQDEPGVDWNSRRDDVNLGTISGNTNEFDLDDEINYIPKDLDDSVVLTSPTGQEAYFTIVDYSKFLRSHGGYAAQRGRVLVLPKRFNANGTYTGWTVTVPAIMKVEDITNVNQDVQVDTPLWLGAMTAAEFIRTDVVNQNQYPNLIAYAEQLMVKMKENNQSSVETLDRGGTFGWSNYTNEADV